MRKQVDSNRRDAKLDNPPGIGQIRNLEAWVLAAKESLQGTQHPPGVRRGRVQQDIKVFCGARLSVVRDGVGADDQVPHSMGI